MTFTLRRLPLLIGVLCMSSAYAQTIPDAGSLQRELERQKVTPPPTTVPAAKPRLPQLPDDGTRFLIKDFAIEGATLIPVDDLKKLIADRIGQQLGMRDLRSAAAALMDFYASRGYFARVYLPAQDVTDGVVSIVVVEGRFGVVRQEGQPPARANADFVASVVASRLKPGEPYSAESLERGLMLANDLPGIDVSGALQAGKDVGTSDLYLSVSDKPLFGGTVGINQLGSRATGSIQTNAAIALSNLSGIGDQVGLQLVGSEGMTYGSAFYSVPLGPDAPIVTLSANTLRYRLTAPQYEGLGARGRASTVAVDLHYPLVRSERKNLSIGLAAEKSSYADDSLGQPIHRKDIEVLSAYLRGDWQDDFMGGASTSYGVRAGLGSQTLSLADDLAQDLAGPHTVGTYTKVTIDLQRNQSLAPILASLGVAAANDWMLRSSVSVQVADKNLPSSDRFSLGGPSGVRAYPVGEATGDIGGVVSVEIHRLNGFGFVRGLDTYAFADAGRIRQYQQAWDGWNAGSAQPLAYSLAGAGIGASYGFTAGSLGSVRLTASIATPVKSNAGAPSTDTNQDGSHRGTRAWLSASLDF